MFILTKGEQDMNLLKSLTSTLNLWRPFFTKKQAFLRAKSHAVAALCQFGKATITSFAIFLGKTKTKPSSDYKLYSKSKWKTQDIFNPILKKCLDYVPDDFIAVGVDDTRLKKTGKKIPFTSWHRDPMSPAFYVNLIWGLRFLQFSVLLPLHRLWQKPPRAIPIRFINAPHIKKPRKKAREEEIKEYKLAKEKLNLSSLFKEHATYLRKTLDEMGYQDKKLLLVGDGSFCNKTCMGMDLDRTSLVARCRKDSKLCFASQKKRKFYGDFTFTPLDVLQDSTLIWQEGFIYYGGYFNPVRYKQIKNVLWKSGTKRKLLKLIVIAPQPYRKAGKKCYRQPAFLLSTDQELDTLKIIQAYFDRLQIEYNHRDEKSILGVGQAQLRNEKSVEKQPALHVAAYSALLLASLEAYQDEPILVDDPPWRRPGRRITLRALKGQLRKSIIESPQIWEECGLTVPILAEIFKKAA